MLRFLTGPILGVAMLIMPAAAQARGPGGSHGSHGSHGSYGRHGSYGTFHHSYHSNYHHGHGTKFSHGYSYYGRHHRHWSHYSWWSKYGCYRYHCPSTSCWYYWSEPRQCYYPCSYSSYATPTASTSIANGIPVETSYGNGNGQSPPPDEKGGKPFPMLPAD